MSQKQIVFSFLLLLAGLLFSCSEGDPCATDKWEGTYNGTVSCDGVSEGVTVIIAAEGKDSIRINYFSPSSSINFTQALPVEECTLDFSAKDAGGTLSLSATLNEDRLTLSEQITIGGEQRNCQITATRFD